MFLFLFREDGQAEGCSEGNKGGRGSGKYWLV